ncbi:MAG: hypothetical protein K9K76_09185 [Halanaerobiales bacterium]|nr:hypothetical protein [Halanaerobiales bacterium]
MKRTEEYLVSFFTGELERKIKRYNKKKNQKWPDSYYCTLNSVSYASARSDTNNISDSTGYRATKLADLRLERERGYNTYLKVKKAIEKRLSSLKSVEVEYLKGYLGIRGQTITQTAEEQGTWSGKVKKEGQRVYKLIEIKLIKLNI